MLPPPPRLSVLLAAQAPVGVIFRRGPTKRVQIVIWNRESDRFKPGPIFKGRIYAEYSDVSPDGRRMIYFAMGGVAWAIPATGGTWTAISELPSLKATALWGQGDTWGGGGMFLSNHAFWLDQNANSFLIRNDSGLRQETYAPKLPFRARLERDGWFKKGAFLEKPVAKGWTLRQLPKSEGHELENDETKLEFPSWEWADWDRNRLAWTENGCLKVGRLGKGRLFSVRTLYDFSVTPPLQSAR